MPPSSSYRPASSARPSTAAQLRRLCSPLVEFNRFDLWWDRQTLRGTPGVPFVCIVRSGGTWLVTLPDVSHPGMPPVGGTVPFLFGQRTREQLADGNLSFLQGEAARAAVEPRTWFAHRGDRKVRQVCPADGVALCLAWRGQLLRAWAKERRAG